MLYRRQMTGAALWKLETGTVVPTLKDTHNYAKKQGVETVVQVL